MKASRSSMRLIVRRHRSGSAQAAAADPKLAIAWWGVALGAGPNLNYPMTADDWKSVHEAVAKAQSLEDGASPEERQLIDAVAKRYPAKATDPDGAAYRDAMAAVHAHYPADEDVATLYVESAMDVDDWGYATNGSPIGKTAMLASTLSDVMARTPMHPGANHYFTHLNDFEGVADRALPAADRLSQLPVEPAASHLKHMSGHIYFDLGLYAAMQRDNRLAVEYDREYAKASGRTNDSLDYYFHNLSFYTGASLMLGDDPEIARASAFYAEQDAPERLLIFDRQQRFVDALNVPVKPTASASLLARWHYARGIADVSLGRLDAADAELAQINAAIPQLEDYAKMFAQFYSKMLSARIAYARGNSAAAIDTMRGLVRQLSNIPPEAVPAYYYPVGEWLGWMLLGSGDAAGAEAAFRAGLARTPHNARALYGLMQALSAQGRTSDGDKYAIEIVNNWRGDYGQLRDRL